MTARREIDIDLLIKLAENHTVHEISKLMNISTCLVYSRLKENNIEEYKKPKKYAKLDEIDTSQYTISELAEMFGVTKNAMWSKLLKLDLKYKGMTHSERKRFMRVKEDVEDIYSAQKMAEIRSKSKLAEKEKDAHIKGMSYADMQKAETLKMCGKVIV